MTTDETTTPVTETSPTAAPLTQPAPTPAAAPAPQDELIDIDHFAKVRLKVATITGAEAVPKSNKLLKLQLDVGPGDQRQIVSGIAKHYTPESLIGKRIVIVANLKPAKLMGVESNGMLLAGSTEDSSVLAILEPHESLPLGATVR